MINLLKADLFRLRKSKTFRNSLIVMLILVAAILFLSLDKEFFFSLNVTFRNDRVYGFSMGRLGENINYLDIFRSSLGFIIFACLTMIFLVTDSVISKYSTGVLKNTISYGHNKYKVYLSSLISNYIGVSVVAVLYISLYLLGATCLFMSDVIISKNELYIIFIVTLVVLIILGAMVSLYTLLSIIIKSKVMIATAGALFITFGSSALFDIISKSIQNTIPIYMLLDICGQPTMSPLLITWTINSLIIIIVSATLGCIIFNRQEIK